MDIKILVAAHKKYRMPEDTMYLPIQTGAEGKFNIGFQRDDEGDSISGKNLRLCELTAIYWAWKNLKADYVGLVHYRRHFTMANRLKRLRKDRFPLILRKEEAKALLQDWDLLLPNKRRYYIETIKSHFLHLPYTFEKDFAIFEKTVKTMYPEYEEAFDTVMNRSWAHMFNMFVMKKEYFDTYCAWLFPVLFEVDKHIDVSGYTAMEAREVAYFGEFMLDIWLEKNAIRYKEVDVMFMEKQNWLIKGGKFLVRKVITNG